MTRLDADGLTALLGWLSSERESAAEEYERHRRRLVLFFAARRVPEPETSADEVFDRTATKLAAGEAIAAKPGAFLLGVARMVAMEERRGEARRLRALAAAPAPAAPDEEHEQRLICLDEALAGLDADQRRLVLDYHRGRGRDRIERRRRLAAELGVGINALRIRLHRMRVDLERQVTDCLRRRETNRPTGPHKGER